MQYTGNLNLKKPEGTDIVNIEDLNENADILDAEVTKLATTSEAGRMSAADKAKLNGVQAGAQANTVTSVAGRTGAVTLSKSDVGLGNVDNVKQATKTEFETHLADTAHIPYVAATGVANTYAVTLTAPTGYTEGMAIAVKINAENTGASTINVNGLGTKAIKKTNGNDVSAGNLKSNSVYTLRYNGVNFILQGEGGEYGTAQAPDVLEGKTIGTEGGLVVGTMPNQGQKIYTPGIANIIIPAGYHDGTGRVNGDADLISANIKAGKNIFGVAGNNNVVDTSPGTAAAGDILSGKIAFVDGVQLTGSMTNRGAYNITPSATNKTIPAGYHNGSGVVAGDADLIASNIAKDKNIFGVIGNYAPIEIDNMTWGNTCSYHAAYDHTLLSVTGSGCLLNLINNSDDSYYGWNIIVDGASYSFGGASTVLQLFARFNSSLVVKNANYSSVNNTVNFVYILD